MTQQTIDKLRDAVAYQNGFICALEDENRPQSEIERATIMLKAAQAALKFIETGGWDGIANAPIDGTVVDLYLIGEMDYFRQVNCYWCKSHQYWCLLDGGLPAIPKHRTAIYYKPTNPADRLLQMIEGGE